MSAAVRWLVRRLGIRSRYARSEAVFHGIRWRLTLWYSGALAVALIVFGIALYFSEQRTLMDPIRNDVQARAQEIARIAQQRIPGDFGGAVCPDFVAALAQGRLLACFDPNGSLTQTSPSAQNVAAFTDSDLAQSALRQGSAEDTIDAGIPFGRVERYAIRVVDPSSGSVVGVVQMGASISGQTQALDVLLQLLIGIGAATLLLTAFGGLVLANRALKPARLAYARQRDFIADASHELRTPLTMLRADADVLLRGRHRFEPDDVVILEDVVSETKHMAALANNMLDLARLDAGETHIEQEVIDLSPMVESVARRARPLAAEKGVELDVETEGEILVVGDQLLLDQAALILVDNAIKYNRPGGHVVIRATASGSQARIEVKDTGIGIAPGDLSRLGERFFRVDKARSREGGGAGLGVSIARSVVSRHGGSLLLSSEPGRGTTAVLSIPAVRGSAVRTRPEPVA